MFHLGNDHQWGTHEGESKQFVFMSQARSSYSMPYHTDDRRYVDHNPPDRPTTLVSQVRKNITGLSRAWDDKKRQEELKEQEIEQRNKDCLLYTSPSPRDA